MIFVQLAVSPRFCAFDPKLFFGLGIDDAVVFRYAGSRRPVTPDESGKVGMMF
jgi:hypothetical protein